MQTQLPVDERPPAPGEGLSGPGVTAGQRHDAGMTVRRQVLSDEHVDRAESGTSAFTHDFQDLLTRYTWGEIWTRSGLDRRTRSAITITALIARGHWDELESHVRGARRNGLSIEQIGEVLLQSAIYCGVPDANRAFAIAQKVLDEETATGDDRPGDANPRPS